MTNGEGYAVMSDGKKQILIVDDSANDIQILMENLKQDYAVLVATSGARALELAAKTPHPDVILMDVMMPEMDGYQACRRLKDNPDTRDIDVIFVSAHDSTEEKLAGYDAGGSDYVIKPVQPVELLQKIKVAIKNRETYLATAAEKTMAMQAAMTAMSSAGEQGVVLSFMRRSFLVDSVQGLADLIVEATGSYMLENSVQLRGSRELVHASSTGMVSPLEQELLSKLATVGRIRENGARLVLNFGAVSQLIKNMPVDNPDKCGRLRDHLAILIEGAEARLHALDMEQQLARLVVDSNHTLQQIESLQKEQKQTALSIMDNVMIQLQASFLSYGLTDDQEEKLMQVVQTGIDKSLDNFEKGIEIDQQLRGIIERLQQFSGKPGHQGAD
ncbi:MAG: response regulator [Gammaproteobacteria bacterium]|nr:response regulator [Gammaproteobacteria bacterium]